MSLLLWDRDPSVPLNIALDSLFGEVTEDLPVSAETAELFEAVSDTIFEACPTWKRIDESEHRTLFWKERDGGADEILVAVECDQVVVQASDEGQGAHSDRVGILKAALSVMHHHGFVCFDEDPYRLLVIEDLEVELGTFVDEPRSLPDGERPFIEEPKEFETPFLEKEKEKKKSIKGWASLTVLLVTVLVGFLIAQQDEADRHMAIATTPAFDIVLKPYDGLPCADPFPLGYRYFGGTDARSSLLQAAVWSDGRARERVAVSPQDPEIEHARCYAVGPHRDLNLENWCCRLNPTGSTKGSPRSSP